MRFRLVGLFADAAVVIWVAAWTFVAVRVGFDVRSLGQLLTPLHSAGHAVATAGGAIGSLGHLPLVGRGFASLGHRVTAAGVNAEVTSSSASTSVGQLSLLLPIVVALLPIVPALVVYLPLRVQRLRESRAVRQVLKQGNEHDVRRFLAHRAVTNLSFHRLEEVSADPWADLASRRYDALADAELKRLGLAMKTPADER